MTVRIALADLRAQHRRLAPGLEQAFSRVVESSRFVLGPEVERFEADAAAYLGVPHAVGVSSGTDALLVALSALGVGSGDEVITTPFTFVATAESIVRLGAVPRFVDIDPETCSLDAAAVERELTARTRAVLPVHLYGGAGSIEPLAALSSARGLPLVEDAAQAFGTRYEGKAAGAWGVFGCYSFFPGKVLGAMGDGGLVVTADGDLAARARRLRQHGGGNGVYTEIGGNHRLDALQAAILGVKLPHLDAFIGERRANAERYDAAFAHLSGVRVFAHAPGWNAAVYTVRVAGGRRDELRARLGERGIETAVYYPRPLHLEPVFASLGLGEGSLPESERAATEVLSLPVHEGLSAAAVDEIIDEVRRFLG